MILKKEREVSLQNDLIELQQQQRVNLLLQGAQISS